MPNIAWCQHCGAILADDHLAFCCPDCFKKGHGGNCLDCPACKAEKEERRRIIENRERNQ